MLPPKRGSTKIDPNYIKPEISIWKSRNIPPKRLDKNGLLDDYTVSEKRSLSKGTTKIDPLFIT